MIKGDPQHRAHDFVHLIARWRSVARNAGLRVQTLCQQGGYPIHYLQPKRARENRAVYLSACIHGDEAAAAWGLLQWAESKAGQSVLSTQDLLLFPCLNPWGLIENVRTDCEGTDLNRIFKDRSHPLIGSWWQLLGERHFTVAISLHEDFDAQGCYAYELDRGRAHVGRQMLEAAKPHIGIAPGASVEGRPMKNGLVRRVRPFDLEWEPEALAIYRAHTNLSITFETPSEFSFAARVQAQATAVEVGISRGLAAALSSAP